MNFIYRLFQKRSVQIVLLLLLLVYLNNSSLLAADREGTPLLLAHRGMAQTFTMEGITGDTCTAERIYPPEHPYLENTIASMEEAFKAGADIVELDIHITKDNQFAVFHDWTLDCRTNGKGTTRDYTLAELKQLDIGYGYTADGGQTYPFRGKGIGLMPSLDEVMEHFPRHSLLLHVKSNDPEEGRHLARYLSIFSEERRELITVYGGDRPIASLREELPSVRAMSKQTMKACLIPYAALGWTGYIPGSCQGRQLHIPEEIAPYLWGWPNRFLQRMEESDVRVIVTGGNGTEFSSGFDSLEDVKRLPRGFDGAIWTNRIDRLAKWDRVIR
ncbi:glycerophosphodiester phosphodiesterase family protein [Paenibacillus silviterrae]|uniref:glycerophosphodiester phosphodiesterase family protein n=1 Tax=Paenibacillus silviterrae TaxID=3242194 RepID=UPI0025439927|nr:glycerophosphodiester phosphodiesterase family protein [Paenibacillus chinjuensis]